MKNTVKNTAVRYKLLPTVLKHSRVLHHLFQHVLQKNTAKNADVKYKMRAPVTKRGRVFHHLLCSVLLKKQNFLKISHHTY